MKLQMRFRISLNVTISLIAKKKKSEICITDNECLVNLQVSQEDIDKKKVFLKTKQKIIIILRPLLASVCYIQYTFLYCMHKYVA